MNFEIPSFIEPEGVNFATDGEINAPSLARSLSRTTTFLQNQRPYIRLHCYDDWWEHDGLHFYREPIDYSLLFQTVQSPRSLLQAMSGDDDVFVGIAPEDHSWYLRFYLHWDEDGYHLLGRFDITLPYSFVDSFRTDVIRALDIPMVEMSSAAYYLSIKV